jgi:RND family efflux transporter MFP subunit
MTQRPLLLPCVAILIGLLGVGCRSHGGSDDHGAGGHDHGGGHAGGEDAHGEERPTMAHTLFDAGHELFVELDVPVAGQPGSFHAHVTRLADNMAATSGRFTVEFRDAMGNVASTFGVENVARQGIFTPEGPAPAQAGAYRLAFRYSAPPDAAEWDGGTVNVGTEPIEPEAAREGDITFLKETSWKIPFRVARPERRAVARHVTVAARVEADPLRTTLLTTPAAGIVTWEPTAVTGSAVVAGAIVARITPAAAFETRSELSRARAEADAELARARADHERVDALAKDGLTSERRRDEARAALARAEAAAGHVSREEGLVAGRGKVIEVKAPAAGLLAEIAAPSGTRVGAGELLARIASDDRVLVRGILRGTDGDVAATAGSMSLRARGWAAVESLESLGGEALPVSRAADPLARGFIVGARIANAEGRLRLGDSVELHVGVGTAEEHLTIPVGAIVEVNTQPSAFVQVTGESFERRRLTLGASDGQRVAVLEGLDENDLVVTMGGFDVHVASLSGTVESHRH